MRISAESNPSSIYTIFKALQKGQGNSHEVTSQRSFIKEWGSTRYIKTS